MKYIGKDLGIVDMSRTGGKCNRNGSENVKEETGPEEGQNSINFRNQKKSISYDAWAHNLS